MKTYYEWSAELMEGEDILDVRHSGSLSSLFPVSKDEIVVLVRDKYCETDGVVDRMWAYIENGRLPENFTYCGDSGPNGVKVPKRFHVESSMVLK